MLGVILEPARPAAPAVVPVELPAVDEPADMAVQPVPEVEIEAVVIAAPAPAPAPANPFPNVMPPTGEQSQSSSGSLPWPALPAIAFTLAVVAYAAFASARRPSKRHG